jgi:nitrite reductase/ring-hydroxylating ferredoxin subunit
MPTLRIPVCPLDQLPPGRTAKFAWEEAGGRRSGLAVNYRGQVRAYVNQCAHIPLSLDVFENDFFDEACRYLVCAMHGALYEPDTGVCVSGPPLGAALDPIRVAVEEGQVVAYVEPRGSRLIR